MSIQFTRATRAQVPLKLGISGPSGSGKTTAALRLGRGLIGPGAPLALLDTENGSASLYSDLTDFDVLNMNPPYQVEKFIAAIDAAAQAGYKCLVIDSASHEWIQILQDKEATDARGGNQWTNWAPFTKKHEAFLAAIRQAPIHLICCLRAKEKHEMNDQKKVVKHGVGSEMRPGFEYELTLVFEMSMDHTGIASKDRTRIFDGRRDMVSESTGQELVTWLSSGKPLAENTGEAFVAIHPTQAPATPETTPTQTTPTTSLSNDPWVSAMAELAIVTVGMPEKTRTALVQSFEKEGPSSLPALLEEIKTIKAALATPARPPEPTEADVTKAFDAAQAAALAAKPEVSQAASSFVDSIDPDTDEKAGGISAIQYEALGLLIEANGINRDALRAYCVKAGHLLPSAHPTLARLKESEFAKLRTRLGGKESAKVVAIINKTPVTTYAAPAA